MDRAMATSGGGSAGASSSSSGGGGNGGAQSDDRAGGNPPAPPLRVVFYSRFYGALGDERAALERVLALKEAFAEGLLAEVVGGVLGCRVVGGGGGAFPAAAAGSNGGAG